MIEGAFTDFLLNFCVAGIASAVSKTITAPFERIKVILQTQNSSLHILQGTVPKYKGVIDCLIRFPKEQGFLSYWRGNGVNVVRYIPTQALNFALNDLFKSHLQDPQHPSMISNFLAGFLAGGMTVSFFFPLEFCQTRIAADVGSNKPHFAKREFRGFRDCVKQVYKVDGFLGLYKGYVIAALGISLYRGFYFCLFDEAKRLYAYQAAQHKFQADKPPLLLAIVLGQVVTMAAGTITYPLDTLGRRMMMGAGCDCGITHLASYTAAAWHIYKYEGWIRGFYNGFLANCLKGFSGALVLALYDEALNNFKL